VIGRGQLLLVASMLFGTLAMMLVYYVTVSPIMLWALLATIAAFSFTTVMALNPALSALLLSGIFGPVKLPEEKKILPERGILLAKHGNDWYATAYAVIHIIRSFTLEQNEDENMKHIVRSMMQVIDALATMQRPMAITLIFAPDPRAKKKLEEYLEATALDRSMPISDKGLFSNPYKKAKAEVRYEALKDLVRRVQRGEQVYDAIRVVRVTARGGTPREAVENAEKLIQKVTGLLAGALPNAQAERLVGEELVRVLAFEYGYMPQDQMELRDDFRSLLEKEAKPP